MVHVIINATVNCKHAYTAESRRILGDVCIPDALLCKHVNCSNPDLVAAIDDLYHSINRSLIASSAHTIRSRHYACRKRHKAVPGWNDTVKHAHGVARNSYIIWRNSGRPRHGPVSDDMRRSRLLFKYILKQCQRNEDQARADAMAESMRNHDMKSFWKDVSSTYSRNVPLATTVNGASYPSAICDMWKKQFKTLLNCVTSDTHKCATIDALSSICDDSYIDVTPDMVSVAIGKLKCGKACGSDRLFAEHYIHADSRLAILLSTFFTSALTHGHVPAAFMQSILVPVIKNKSGDSNYVNNYRPIALVTIASKIFRNDSARCC